jgi:hypothetical protein
LIRGLTRELNTATGTLNGVVEDTGNAPIEGATLTTDPANLQRKQVSQPGKQLLLHALLVSQQLVQRSVPAL